MKQRTTLPVMALAAALSLPSLAVEPARPGPEGNRLPANAAKRDEMQQKMKERLIKHVDARIQILENARACIKAAADMKAINVCYEQERRRTKELRNQARADF